MSNKNISESNGPQKPPIVEQRSCCQKEMGSNPLSATCPECGSRLPPPDGIDCWLFEDQRNRPWPPGKPALGDRYIPYSNDIENVRR